MKENIEGFLKAVQEELPEVTVLRREEERLIYAHGCYPREYKWLLQGPYKAVSYTHLRSAKSAHSRQFDDGSFTDEWGCYWKKTMIDGGHFYFELQNPPLADATIEDLESYDWRCV